MLFKTCFSQTEIFVVAVDNIVVPSVIISIAFVFFYYSTFEEDVIFKSADILDVINNVRCTYVFFELLIILLK